MLTMSKVCPVELMLIVSLLMAPWLISPCAAQTTTREPSAAKTEPPERQVPDFTNLTQDAAKALAARYHLEPRFVGQTNADARVGIQSPRPGTILRPGTAIELTMEIPPAPPPPLQKLVPNFYHHTVSEAEALAAEVGLSLTFEGPRSANALIVSQSERGGTPITPALKSIQLETELSKPPPPGAWWYYVLLAAAALGIAGCALAAAKIKRRLQSRQTLRFEPMADPAGQGIRVRRLKP
jgi:PASTA domain